ncbi:MAG TPA: SHOCT domain-containing protein [Pseudonocardia sp.]
MNLWDVLLSIFWFMILFAWIWLLISILGDIFRDHELSGWGKALWTLFLVVVPWLGALVYLIARGHAMNERALERAQRTQQQYSGYVGRNTGSTADEIAKLADLRDRGAISEEEFQHAKAKALGRDSAVTGAVNSGDRQPVAAQTT